MAKEKITFPNQNFLNFTCQKEIDILITNRILTTYREKVKDIELNRACSEIIYKSIPKLSYIDKLLSLKEAIRKADSRAYKILGDKAPNLCMDKDFLKELAYKAFGISIETIENEIEKIIIKIFNKEISRKNYKSIEQMDAAAQYFKAAAFNTGLEYNKIIAILDESLKKKLLSKPNLPKHNNFVSLVGEAGKEIILNLQKKAPLAKNKIDFN